MGDRDVKEERWPGSRKEHIHAGAARLCYLNRSPGG